MRTLRIIAVTATAALVATAVGAGARPVARGAKSVSPKSYAKSWCNAVNAWVDATEPAAEAIDQAVEGAEDPDADLDALRDDAVDALGDAKKASEKLAKKAKGFGDPKVDGGKAIQKRTVKVFGGFAKKLDKAVDALAEVDTDDPDAFRDDVEAVDDELAEDFEDASKLQEAIVDNEELIDAFYATSACEKLFGTGDDPSDTGS